MKQFIYAKRYVDTFHLSSAAENQSYDLGIVDVDGVYNLALRDGKGLEKYYPICSKDLTIVTAKYSEPEPYLATFTIPEVSPYSDYTVIFVKKGKQFNERANWTCTVHTTTKDNAETVAKKIETYLINNKASLKLGVELNGATINVTSTIVGENYEIKLADELMGEPVTQTYAKDEFMNLPMVKDLAAKCAADAGFEYTAEDALELYPGLETDFSDTTEFGVITLRFTEPRVMGTREESIYQIIQIAVPVDRVDYIVEQFKNKLGIE